MKKISKISNLSELLKDSCRKYSREVLFEIQNKQITYQQFLEDVLLLASQRAQRFKDEFVLILGSSSYEWAVAYFSIVISSGVAVLGQADLTNAKLLSVCSKYKIKTVFCDSSEKGLNLREYDIDIINFNEMFANAESSFDYQFENIPENKVCTIAFTSGTTEESKGVMLSHKNLCSDVVAGCEIYEYKKTDLILSVVPFYHAFGLVCVLFASMISGNKLVLSNVGEYFADLKRVKPTFIHLVPEMTKFLLKKIELEGLKKATGGHLKKIMCGGAQIDKETVEKYKNLGIMVSGCYGLTECSPCISINTLQRNRSGTAGIPIPCNEIKISEDNQEILVKGDNVMVGYYENESLTEEVIVAGWFHTGDVGFIKDGFLTVIGRIKNLIVLESGKKVSPEELEASFAGYSEVDEILVFEYQNRICAKIFSEKFLHKKIKIERIQEIVDEVSLKLPLYKRIKKFELVASPIEKTALNKLKRRDSEHEKERSF